MKAVVKYMILLILERVRDGKTTPEVGVDLITELVTGVWNPFKETATDKMHGVERRGE